MPNQTMHARVFYPAESPATKQELTIGGVIGDGAMGVVYRAKWRETDVAVKCLKNYDEV